MSDYFRSFSLSNLMAASRCSRNLPEFIAQCKILANENETSPSNTETFVLSLQEPVHQQNKSPIEHTITLRPHRPVDPSEKAVIAHQINELRDYIHQQIEWFDKIEQAKRLVYSDDVTTLFNSRFLKLALKQECERYQRFKQPFSVLFIDLDGFKRINDEFGHLVGSAILRQFGRFVKQHVRNIDLVFRYGGDEFVVILLGAVASEARKIATRLCEKIAQQKFKVGADRYQHLTASIGIASLPEHAEDYLSLLKFADKSMYYSKESGKNQVTVFSQEIDQHEQTSQSKSSP